MTDLPHVIAGQIGVSEEHIRVVEAWWREHNDGPPPLRWTASMYNAAVDWANALGAQLASDEPPPDVPVYQMPDGSTMWGTWEADDAEQQPDRLTAVMAYCAAHPYDGPEPDVQPLYFEQRYDYDADTRTVSTPRGVPEFTEIAAFFLEDDDSIVRFEDDAVVFPVQPRTLRYRPLYARHTSRTIVLQRIDDEDDKLAEVVAQAWNYGDTGDEDAT